ncbi:GntR family transcriptional regulator [Nocardioides sp. QY071]|uniref:GntR family transcriptional regulator n=1 Tax=Nocardioides sp. QY071 TaxID=3044187 RepID=UPI00249A27F3|nr:GntR family transcriptional regulator [Nocardioides sp. QY071]WGY00376.1 GntR family transcriptional regulator [Nocardioides sp. QY071]
MNAAPPATNALIPLSARPENLTSMVYSQIRDRIIDATFPPGSSVSEASLATQLGVSKTPVREALLRLRQAGLVEPTTRGLRVIEPSAKMIADAFELRAALEATAGRYAADRIDATILEALASAASDSLAAARGRRASDFHDDDRRFHTVIATAAGNDVLSQTMDNSFALTQALRQRDVALERDFVTDAEEHVAIAEAIRAGDGELAARRSSEHILRIMGQLLGAFGASHDDEDDKDT